VKGAEEVSPDGDVVGGGGCGEVNDFRACHNISIVGQPVLVPF
jgi:hypothetical protein